MKWGMISCLHLLFCSALVVFHGCAVEIAGGGDDFPNSVSTLGKRINECLGKEWEELDTANVDSIIMNTERSLDIDEYNQVAKKMSTLTSIDSLLYDSSDIRRGIIHYFYFYHSDSTNILDTTSYRFYPEIRVMEKRGKIEYRSRSCTLYYHIEDYDGDSLLADPKRELNRVLSHRKWVFDNGRVTCVTVGLDAGPDRSLLSGEDNSILFKTVSYMESTDTLLYIDLRRPETSECIYSPFEQSSVPVDVHRVQFFTGYNNPIFRSETNYRVIYSPATNSSEYVNSYRGIKNWIDGKTTEIRVTTVDGVSFFEAGDTITVFNIIRGKSSDSLVIDSVTYTVVLGVDYPDLHDCLIIKTSCTTEYRQGGERLFRFTFTPNVGTALGTMHSGGYFDLLMKLDDGLEISVLGTVTAEAILAHYTDSRGDSRDLFWDREGP